jgi:PI-3-kinase-related kinase SMG-1
VSAELLLSLRQPPQELLKLATEGEQSEDSEDSEDASDNSAATAAATDPKQPGGSKCGTTAAAAGQAGQPADGGWPLLKQLRQQLQQHLRRRQHLQLVSVAPQLSKLRNTAIPLPADDLTANMLPPLTLKAALDRYAASEPAAGSTADIAGASVLLAATGAGAAAAGEGGAAGTGSSGSSSSWLCIAAFDKQVAVLPTKTRPKRLLMQASDGSVHAFLLKGRDDLRVDERLMQFMQASNALLAGQEAATGTAATAAGHTPTSAAAAAVAGWSGGRRVPLRVRPYSITPFGRRAGLVQWVRHTTSLYGLFRNWQQCAAERYQAVAAAKRDAAAAAAAATTSAPAAGSAPGERQSEKQPAAAGSASSAAKGAAQDGGSSNSSVPLPLIVAASRPPDAFYARLLPALQAAGLPVGSSRSSWPASKDEGLCAVVVAAVDVQRLVSVCLRGF